MSNNLIQQHSKALEQLKKEYFGDSIECFDFFCYAPIRSRSEYTVTPFCWAHKDDYKSTSKIIDPAAYGFNFTKIDTSVEFISSDAAKKYRNAVLPKGINSISLRIKPEHNQSESQKAATADLAKKSSDALRWWLHMVLPDFLEVIKCVITDLMNYGNASIEYYFDDRSKKVIFRALPFQLCYFGNKKDDDFSFLFKENRTRIDQNGAIKTEVINNLYISGKIAGRIVKKEGDQVKYDYPCILSKFVDESTDYNDVILFRRNPIYIARQDVSHTYKKLDVNLCTLSESLELGTYGRGAGIKSLGHIIQANISLQLKNNGAISAIHPAIVMPLGTIMNKGNEKEGYLSTAPGAVNTITTDGLPQPGMLPQNAQYTVATDPQYIMTTFNETYNTHIKQVENAYNTSIFSMLNETGRNPTATEITLRSQETAQTFKGEASAFYSEILIKLMTDLVNDLITYPDMAKLGLSAEDHKNLTQLKDKKWHIDVFSFEDERNQLAQEELLKSRIATLVQLAPLVNQGLNLTGLPSVLEGLISEYTDLINNETK